MEDKTVMVSGGFDPVHIGHVRMFYAAKKLGTKLIVIINSDKWLIRKKGFAFMPEQERAKIIAAMKPVDEVHIYKSRLDDVSGAIKVIRPNIFANGGDRTNEEEIPETAICKELGIEMVFNVGGGKIQSSSCLTKKIPR